MKPRKGGRRPLTDVELDRLAEITEADKLRAAEAWRRAASPRFKNLLDAQPWPGEGKHVKRG
jgi:hypothetical protein